MKPRRRSMLQYSEVRALEDALAGGVSPVGVSKVLLPVWAVEIRATITTSEPYDVIDRALETGIAGAGLTSVPSLAGFLGLDAALVDRALRFLAAIGHVTRSGDDVRLTKLGADSVKKGRRLLTTQDDRRILYFDAFRSTPLTRPYYESRDVTLLDGDAARRFAEEDGGATLLTSTYGFRRESLADLVSRPEREREQYNLPERIDDLESLGENMLFLPVYIVRAQDASAESGYRHLVYSETAQTWDSGLSVLADSVPEITVALTADTKDLDTAKVEARLHGMDPAATGPTQLSDGSWRATFTADAFEQGSLSYAQLGSYMLWGAHAIRIWCDDAEARRTALVERMDKVLAARTNLTRDVVEAFLERISAQLGLSGATVDALARLAERRGSVGLVIQLAAIDKDVRD